jgi:hypothetical protein
MGNALGITHEGLNAALGIKEDYKKGFPICLPGEDSRMLMPENLMNHGLDLRGFEDPLALAMMAARDPETPMALAAAARLSPLAGKTKLVSGIYDMVAEMTKHPLVSKSISLVTESAFNSGTIAQVRHHASKVIVHTRTQYTMALRQNLHALLEGVIAPRRFVREFFELVEAGNMRNDIRKKLVLSLLLSANIRPSIKFLLLENLRRIPKPVRLAIISEIFKAKPSRDIDIMKEELKWILGQENQAASVH